MSSGPAEVVTAHVALDGTFASVEALSPDIGIAGGSLIVFEHHVEPIGTDAFDQLLRSALSVTTVGRRDDRM